MQLKQLFVNDDAVSPVIGVILMVAITVILAAVIGTFVLGLGDQVQESAPQANFAFDYTEDAIGTDAAEMNDTLIVTHDGGDSISGDELNLTVSSAVDDTGSGAVFGDDAFTGETSAGTSYNLTYTSFNGPPDGLDLSDSSVRVVWNSKGGGDSATLARWDGPDA